MNTLNRLFALSAALILFQFNFACNFNPAMAQSYGQDKAGIKNSAGVIMPQNKRRVAKKSQAQIEMETYYKHLSKPVSLPELPDISGHSVFRFGLENTDKSGFTNIGQRYGTRSTAQEVVDFYKQALLGEKWKLNMVSQTTVRAEKPDKSVTINIMPKSSPDVATDFMLNYTYKNR
ncbi:MAG: hypothetical protein K2X81_29075 [Candidatus Obscuribacterales bacterium]|nr:hypothetical protein [Candidatus Obscuribacterales bacterium]